MMSFILTTAALVNPAFPPILLNDGLWTVRIKSVVIVSDGNVAPPKLINDVPPDRTEQCLKSKNIFGLVFVEDACRVRIDRTVFKTVYFTADCVWENGTATMAGKIEHDNASIKGTLNGIGTNMQISTELSGQKLGPCSEADQMINNAVRD